MTDTLSVEFSVASALAFMNWVMIVLPQYTVSQWFEHTKTIPVLLSLLYVFHIIATFSLNGEGGFSSLDEVAMLFSDREAILAGWVHYLAFDIVVAYTIQKEGLALGWKNTFLIPFYLFTFMLGPIGFLGFQVTKRIVRLA